MEHIGTNKVKLQVLPGLQIGYVLEVEYTHSSRSRGIQIMKTVLSTKYVSKV
jgi:hypothetical protein